MMSNSFIQSLVQMIQSKTSTVVPKYKVTLLLFPIIICFVLILILAEQLKEYINILLQVLCIRVLKDIVEENQVR